MRPYIKDPMAIYAESFATVRREAKMERFPEAMQPMVTRLIHSCGMVEIADRLAFTDTAMDVGHAALVAGKPVLCDCEMVGAGVIRRYLPAENDVVVTLNDPSVPERAKSIGNTPFGSCGRAVGAAYRGGCRGCGQCPDGAVSSA